MRHPRLIAAAATAALALAGAVFFAQPAGATVYGGPGYMLYAPNMKGSPYQQQLWLDPHAYKANVLNDLLRNWAALMQSWGVDVTYVGYGAAPPVAGSIDVSTGSCAPGYSGWTFDGIGSYPNGDQYVTNSTVTICTGAFSDGIILTQTVNHELGHALGLGHYPYVFDGSTQVMAPVGSSASPYEYQSGDRNGIGYLATQSWGLRHGAT